MGNIKVDLQVFEDGKTANNKLKNTYEDVSKKLNSESKKLESEFTGPAADKWLEAEKIVNNAISIYGVGLMDRLNITLDKYSQKYSEKEQQAIDAMTK